MLLIFDLDDTLYDKSFYLTDDYTDEDLSKIKVFPGVLEFLGLFKGKKVLVTKETDEGLQNRKIDILGIRDFFEEIMICRTDEEKKDLFKRIIIQFPEEEVIWVVGDRRDSEIRYGNELGLKTVLLRHGKYKDLEAKDELEIPNHEIENFSKLVLLFETRRIPPFY